MEGAKLCSQPSGGLLVYVRDRHTVTRAVSSLVMAAPIPVAAPVTKAFTPQPPRAWLRKVRLELPSDHHDLDVGGAKSLEHLCVAPPVRREDINAIEGRYTKNATFPIFV